MSDGGPARPCFRCLSLDIVTDTTRGDVICRGCGEVLTERLIDSSAEWRSFEEDEGRPAEGQRAERPSGAYGLSQTVFTGGTEAQRTAMQRAQQEVENKVEVKILHNLEIVKNICARLNLKGNTIDAACSIFGQAISECKTRYQVEPLAAAAVYVACRSEGFPRTLHEVFLVSEVPKKKINKIQSEITKELRIETDRVTPESLVTRIASSAKLNVHVVEFAKRMCGVVAESLIMEGKPPQLVAAAVIVISATLKNIESSSSRPLALQAVADASFVSMDKIGRAYKLIREYSESVLGAMDTSVTKIPPFEELLRSNERLLEAARGAKTDAATGSSSGANKRVRR